MEAERVENTLPQGGNIQVYDWCLLNLAAYRCQRGGADGEAGETMSVELLGHMTRFAAEHESLEELLDALILSAFRKKPDIGDSSPCRIFGFRDSTKGQEDRSLLEGMLGVTDSGEFESRVHALARRYASLANSRNGVLIFLLVSVRAKNVPEDPFLCVFKCDFEEACSIREDVSVDQLHEVIFNKLKKVIIYPHFNGYQRDFGHLKLFQSTSSDYFEELFWLDKPAVAHDLIQHELRKAMALRHQDRFEEHFVSPPPRKRELFGDERYIPLNDLLNPEEVRFVTDEVCLQSREKLDRPVKVQIKVDGNIKVEADLSELGRKFFFAKRGEFRYLILRGESFVTGGPLSSLDFLDVQELDEVIPDLSDDGGSSRE